MTRRGGSRHLGAGVAFVGGWDLCWRCGHLGTGVASAGAELLLLEVWARHQGIGKILLKNKYISHISITNT